MIGIIGGSGFYSLLDDMKEKNTSTPYGKPSSTIRIGKIGNKTVAFIARHGDEHDLPPHKVPFKANAWALKQLGVKRILATSACGSLKKDIKPGDIVIPDQFVNFTRREDTFYDGPETVHVSSHEPYCSELRKIIFDAAATNGLPAHPKGTVVVIQGPRFSSQAESHFFRKLGFDIVNMTQYPEVMLARELEMCYASVCIVTDYDTGMQDSDVMPVTVESFLKVFQQNVDKIKKLMIDITPKIPEERKCICKNALENAKL